MFHEIYTVTDFEIVAPYTLQVRFDDESGTLVWPNEADFDPATLHDWPEVGEAISLAQAWPDPPAAEERPALVTVAE